MKFAIITPVAPPSSSGQAIVLFRLLKDLNPENYIIISSGNYGIEGRGSQETSTKKLKGKYFFLPLLSDRLIRQLLRLNKLGVTFFLKMYVHYRTNKIIEILKAEGCGGVIGCTADLIDPYCAFLSAKKMTLPFIFYAFDDYIDQWTGTLYFHFSEKYGPKILRGADKTIVPNECLKRYYSEEFGIAPEVVHNPVNIRNYSEIHPGIEGEERRTINIVYTGAIYGAQLDAFKDFLSAIKILNTENIIVSIYTGQRCPDLTLDCHASNIRCLGYHHSSLIPEIQKNADILFLPLAFKSEFSDNLIKTSSPGKMGEYLAAGRPILVYAPPGSFVNWYFRKYDCGVVVDTQSPEELARAIDDLILNHDLRDRLSRAAFQRAKEDFDEDTIKSHFYSTVSECFPENLTEQSAEHVDSFSGFVSNDEKNMSTISRKSIKR